VIYGFIWELRETSTTPAISVQNGYIVEHTPGMNILVSLVIGVFSSFICTTMSLILSAAYIMSKFPKTKLSDHEFSKKSFSVLILVSVIFNLLAVIYVNSLT
jgi:hypothetical protein